jgi:macrophage erythroblast attacher
VEFVKAKNYIQAIAYARKYLAPWGSAHMKELQRVTATLVFRSSTNCTPYKVSSIFSVLSYDKPLCHG